MKVVELTPTNGRKSFGGKAKVIITDDKYELLSYTTIVATYNKSTNEYQQLFEKNSSTTNTHLKAFKNFLGI